MTFAQDEASVQDSRPRELYTIAQSLNVIYHVASGQVDVFYNSVNYIAEPLSRTEVGVPTLNGSSIVQLTLPLSHPLCQRYMSTGIPPRRPVVEITRLQLNSMTSDRQWMGEIVQMDIEGHTAKFTIPSRLQRAIKRRLPLITVGTPCQNILYDANCRVSSGPFTKATTVARVDGRDVHLNTIAEFGDETWALGGEIVHTATGERQTVMQEDGIAFDGTTHFVMQVGIPEMKTGDTVTVSAGCRHDIVTCRVKFNNVVNYVGQPNLPTGNIFTITQNSIFNR